MDDTTARIGDGPKGAIRFACPKGETKAEMRAWLFETPEGRALHNTGDLLLVWANEGDLFDRALVPAPAVPDDVAKIVAELREWDHCWPAPWLEGAVRKAADALEAQAAELARLNDKLELERALTDGAHRRARQAEAEAARLRDENAGLREELARVNEALEWYGDQARLARLIHSGGDAGRHALQEDGGTRARAAFARNDALRAALTQPTGD